MSTAFAPRLFDAHFHLGFVRDPATFLAEAAARDLGACCMSVLPDDADELSRAVSRRIAVGGADAGTPRAEAASGAGADAPAAADGAGDLLAGTSFLLSAGVHPFWSCEVGDRLEEAATKATERSFVGEIGLDFGKRAAPWRAEQLRLFEAIARRAAERGGRVLSVHAVRAATEALDILERAGCFDSCTVVFHWFSGTSEELARAVRKKALFSVGPRMLDTRRGRAYAASVPDNLLLVETDDPVLAPDSEAPVAAGGEKRRAHRGCVSYGVDEWEARLEGAYRRLGEVRGKDLFPILRENVQRVYFPADA